MAEGEVACSLNQLPSQVRRLRYASLLYYVEISIELIECAMSSCISQHLEYEIEILLHMVR